MPLPKFGDDFEFPDEKEERLKKTAQAEDDNVEIEIEDDTPP